MRVHKMLILDVSFHILNLISYVQLTWWLLSVHSYISSQVHIFILDFFINKSSNKMHEKIVFIFFMFFIQIYSPRNCYASRLVLYRTLTFKTQFVWFIIYLLLYVAVMIIKNKIITICLTVVLLWKYNLSNISKYPNTFEQ